MSKESKSTRFPSATIAFQSKEEKDRYKAIAESYGLTLSSFFKLSATEYYRQHPWNKEEK